MGKKLTQKSLFNLKVARIFLLLQLPLTIYAMLTAGRPEALYIIILVICALVFSVTGLSLVKKDKISPETSKLLVLPYSISVLFAVAFGLIMLAPLFISIPLIGFLFVMLGRLTIYFMSTGTILTVVWIVGAALSLMALRSLYTTRQNKKAKKVDKYTIVMLAIIILSIPLLVYLFGIHLDVYFGLKF